MLIVQPVQAFVHSVLVTIPRNLNMGFWRRFKNRVKEFVARLTYNDDFQAKAYFYDGGTTVWIGAPVGEIWENWRHWTRGTSYVYVNFRGTSERFTADD